MEVSLVCEGLREKLLSNTDGSLEEFQLVVNELAGDKSMDRIRMEYEKLLSALKKSRDSEKILMLKCRELNAEIVSASKAAAALKLSQEDQAALKPLKMELDEAWKMVATAHDKQEKDSETLKNLKEDISNLTKTTFQQPESSEDHQQYSHLTHGYFYAQLQQELQVQQNEISRETRTKEKLVKEVKQLHADMENKMADNRVLGLQSQKVKEEKQKLEQQLTELKMLQERSIRDLEQLQMKNAKLQQECEHLSSAKERLSLENQQTANKLKVREEEVSLMHQEVAKQTKMRKVLQKKLHQVEDQKAEADVQKERLKAHTAALEKDLESFRNQMGSDKKARDEMIRERDLLHKNMIRAVQSTEKQQSLVKVLEQDKKVLENEISAYIKEAQMQRKAIHQLEKERDHYINETNSLMQRVQQNIRDAEVREMEVFDWRKKVTEAESKVKQQENLLESVVSERNLYSRNLTETQIAEMKRKMKIMTNQVTQLKYEIIGKEEAIAKDQQENKHLRKSSEALKEELQETKLQLDKTRQIVDSQKAEEQNLQKVIANIKSEQIQQNKQLEKVSGETESLSKQLLQRNNERALLYEKIKIQQSVLSNGDFHYNQRLEDIRLLKMEIKQLNQKKTIIDKSLPNTEKLRTELFHLQKELLREKARSSILEEQLKPINIHRWRRLEGSDPGKYQLIQKIQSLQKRLIVKTQELEERELLLQEKEKLYVELKHVLARRPGPEAAEQLQRYQWTIRDRTKKLKALTAELLILDLRMKEFKSENQRLENELANVKYLHQKKALQVGFTCM
uniref:Cilia and flagella associated protein 58 n=1 Tax=Nothobranchius furzeri TaxID=105023 RepID=A0A8C6P3Y2_NOTFU